MQELRHYKICKKVGGASLILAKYSSYSMVSMQKGFRFLSNVYQFHNELEKIGCLAW